MFETQTSAAAALPGTHSTPGLGENLKTILNVLVEEEVFELNSSARSHETFSFSKLFLQKSGAANKEVEKKVRSLIFTLMDA